MEINVALCINNGIAHMLFVQCTCICQKQTQIVSLK